jgi:predicted O-methyltransferase YrrM
VKRADYFAKLCDERGITRAVEVGVERGIFARDFLSAWHGEVLVCVDTWAPYPHMPYCRDGDFALAMLTLAPFIDRLKVIRHRSPEAAKMLANYGPPGFVYIDGDHDYGQCLADITGWWPVLSSGGILAGHDHDAAGVARAVREFADEHGLQVKRDHDAPASWWTVKP